MKQPNRPPVTATQARSDTLSSALIGGGSVRFASVHGGDHRHPRQQPAPLGGVGVRRIRTGKRWTILVKLPVALSGGSSANTAPEAGATLSTRLRQRRPNVSTSSSHRLPGADAFELGLL